MSAKGRHQSRRQRAKQLLQSQKQSAEAKQNLLNQSQPRKQNLKVSPLSFHPGGAVPIPTLANDLVKKWEDAGIIRRQGDLSPNTEQSLPLQQKVYSQQKLLGSIQTQLILHSQAGSQHPVVKAHGKEMEVKSFLKKASARLEQPLIDLRTTEVSPLIRVTSSSLLDVGWSVESRVIDGKSLKAENTSASPDVAWYVLYDDGINENIVASIFRVPNTSENGPFVRRYRFPKDAPLFVVEYNFDKITGQDVFTTAQKTVVDILCKSQTLFELPLAIIPNESTGERTIFSARFRAEATEGGYKLVGIARVSFEYTENPSSRTYYSDAELALNIGEFTDFVPDQELIEQAYVSSLDAALDLEVGFTLICWDCNVNYVSCTPLSSDRLVMALSNRCLSCAEGHSPQSFQDAAPIPF